MALTDRRLAGALLVAMALVTVALLPPPVDQWERERLRPPPRSQTRPERLQRASATATWRLDALEVREYARGVIRRAATGSAPQLLVEGPSMPDLIRQRLRSTWDSATARLGAPTDARAIVILHRREAGERFGSNTTYLLPRATDGRTCAVVVDFGPGTPLSMLVQPGFLHRALGPCAYYHALGQPGPHIEAWLLASGLRLAYEADWWGPAERQGLSIGPVAAGGLDGILQAQFDRAYRDNLEETACAAGRLETCASALAGQERTFFGRRVWPALEAQGVVNRRSLFRTWWATGLVHFMEDLMRAYGRERVVRFWTSPAPVDSAFAAAFDIPLDRYTSTWLKGDDPVRLGPLVRTSSVLLSLVAVIAVVGGAAALTTRRQVV